MQNSAFIMRKLKCNLCSISLVQRLLTFCEKSSFFSKKHLFTRLGLHSPSSSNVIIVIVSKYEYWVTTIY